MLVDHEIPTIHRVLFGPSVRRKTDNAPIKEQIWSFLGVWGGLVVEGSSFQFYPQVCHVTINSITSPGKAAWRPN